MKRLLLLISLMSLTTELFCEGIEELKRKDSVRESAFEIGKLEEKEISVVNNFKNMFKDGEVSGQVRVVYAGYNNKNSDPDLYATAIGGILKYELAEYKGFNAGVAFYTAKDIPAFSGEGEKRNTELSSSEGEDQDMNEAYINYKYNNFNLRLGRQVLNTPLADSDDIRMIQNTFEAYVASYIKNGWELQAGNIQSWHGIDLENGLDDGWKKLGDNGVNFAGARYYDMWEFQSWYYNITGLTNAFYIDFGVEYPFNDDFTLHIMAQYLNEQELKSSGYEASIYGGLCEFVFGDLGVNFAYNHADKKTDKESFSGAGGGTLFTNMDMMIMDNITKDREVDAIVSGLVYNHDTISLLYAYGDFSGKANSLGEKAHIVEQNFNIDYNINDEFLVAFIYIMSEDKQSVLKTEYDYDRTQLMINYNF
ncbi:hypothetical protein [Sulfurimonas microaerophilic]|uniref:hypothetical protein n=1 Tax=Sulfurimonas microaerophilic TaxID=3058392 RepID=UPI0027153A56|nr:hypothetical protein [Sulfurimonas sp. hsl 1-7]